METKPPYAGQTRSENFMYCMSQASDAYKEIYGVRPHHLYSKWRDWVSDADMYWIRYHLGQAAPLLAKAEALVPKEAFDYLTPETKVTGDNS